MRFKRLSTFIFDTTLLSAIFLVNAGGQSKSLYSWERQQAAVSATGDLQWAPDQFQFTPGNSVRYIDFENGDDNNSGTSTLSPWKHHPWDAAATGNARSCSGIHTYVFRRGVIYRGYLYADDNGDPGIPCSV